MADDEETRNFWRVVKLTSKENIKLMGSLAKGEITPIQQMIASGSGAIVTSLFMTPLDVIKTRLQAQAKNITQNRCYIFCNGLMDHLCLCTMLETPYNVSRPPLQFKSTLDAFIKIPRYEGITSLWRGLPPTLVMAVPNTMIYFTLYDHLKVYYGFKSGERNVWSPMLSGITARNMVDALTSIVHPLSYGCSLAASPCAISVTIISPIEMIRTKLQSRSGYRYRELGSVIRNAIQQGGMLSLWQGLGPTLLRDLPFSAFYWFGYEFLRSNVPEPGFWSSFICGAGSGLVAAVLTQPFDVVKTHRQIELGELELYSQKRLSFTASIILKLYREKGISSLFAGIAPRMVKVPPACAIMISIYEFGKSSFTNYNGNRTNSLRLQTSD